MSTSFKPLELSSLAADAVPVALYRRHLGLPACAELDERLESLADGARRWYLQHGQPSVVSRQIGIQRIVYDVIHLQNRLQLTSALLAQGFARAAVDRLIVLGITAGGAVDQRIDELWRGDRPDEAMFLNAYAIATVEHLRWQAGDSLRQTLAGGGLTRLPHYSPGYDGWGLADQARLFKLLQSPEDATSGPIQLLASGGLTPHKSTLAAYGVTSRSDFDERLDEYWSCRATPNPRGGGGNYAFPEKTLKKWRDQRLKLKANSENSLLATFRFDGSTCNNLGVPLAFDYVVNLAGDADGRYRISGADCQPVPDHRGYKSMCAYLDKPERFMSQLAAHRPLLGQHLHEALTWTAAVSPAGCLCSRASQDHKWRIVFQTIHYALEDQ